MQTEILDLAKNETDALKQTRPEGSISNAIIVYDYQVAGLFSFSKAVYDAAEDSESVSLTVTRSHGTQGRVGISFVTEGITATAGGLFRSFGNSGIFGWRGNKDHCSEYR